MSYQKRMSLLVGVDILLVWFSVYTSYYLRFPSGIPEEYRWQCVVFLIVSTIVYPALMFSFRLYNRIWQYASVGEMLSIFKSVAIGTIAAYALVYILVDKLVPTSIFVRAFETILLMIGASRFAWRMIRDNYYRKRSDQSKVLIIGAGDCGTLIAKELKHNGNAEMYPVAFIDDNPLKQRQQIYGIPIAGGRERIVETVDKLGVEHIIIAMPSVSRRVVSEIIEICKTTKAKLKIIPKLDDLIQGKVAINEMRDVQVEDLLGRDPIRVDLEGIANYVESKTVLVTGAGGSIGSELCRQIAPFRPAKLLLLGHGENSIYNIEMELRRVFPELAIEPIIADVQDRERIDEVFRTFTPEVVFHAAAHKHVPLMERNPVEAIKNNVWGTKNVAECADKYRAERFVLISTDKAVNPTSIMGATKRLAEMVIRELDQKSRTKFAAVRFGNVLGSRGSVIPRFKEQIARGGPVTVTHPDMIRYFMTIPEAVQLVIQAGALVTGGEIFILDMGEPVSILELAKDLIRLSGFEPGVDIEIEYSGIRPGEKLYEELLTDEEGITSTKHDRIFISKPEALEMLKFDELVGSLEEMAGFDQKAVRKAIGEVVLGYQNVS